MTPLKISVVTVCYNMAPYIEQTLRSVLDADYPNLEYIVIDGGSTDGTQAIIERYRDRLAYYVSEPDGGMYDALAKGFERATGEVMAWLNADDCYFPWTLQTVSEIFSKWQDVQWIGGRYAFLNAAGEVSEIYPKCSARSQRDMRNGWCRREVLGPLQQESMFWRRALYLRSGGLDCTYRSAGDFELWMRFAAHAPLVKVDRPLAAFRRRPDSLSVAGVDRYDQEVERALGTLPRFPNGLWRLVSGCKACVQLLRMTRYRRVELCRYDRHQQLQRKTTWSSTSNHTLCSLLFHR